MVRVRIMSMPHKDMKTRLCVLSTKIADGFLVELQDNDDDDDK